MLEKELAQTLEREQQAVLLLNRRGYASWLYCPACKHRVQCPNCKVSMVFHQSRQQAICHHCHARIDVPQRCPDPSCRSKLVRGGSGTQRIEEELSRSFPQARITRADSDTMTHADKYKRLIADFEAGRIDVLVGTQMIAKGLDFPNVSLVGVIGADVTSAAADFRVSERLFQLVSQVAGRAGRADVPGTVVVQSLTPDLPALRFAADHDFEGFAESELRRRKLLDFPPFVRLARFVVSGKRDRETAVEAEALGSRLTEVIKRLELSEADVFGPQPCLIERLRRMYRHEVLLRAATAQQMQQVLDEARNTDTFRVRSASLMVDVDPVTLV